jgi:hypothetical protein
VGSGLRKMLAIGLGKIDGAFACHLGASRHGLETVIHEVARVVVGRLPVLLGVGLVEDGHHRLGRVEVLAGSEFESREPELLQQAREWMPVLPFADVDVLVLDEMGKNVSGAGMDPNVVGRGVDGLPFATGRTRIRALFVRGLTPESHGNAAGVGLADVVRTRLVKDIDPVVTFTNALSAMTPASVRTPMHFDTDRACLDAALRISGVPAAGARVVRVRNTLLLDRLLVSPALLPDVRAHTSLTVVGPERPWTFDARGDLAATADPLAAG